MVPAIRRHLQRYHREAYEGAVAKFKLKGYDGLAASNAAPGSNTDDGRSLASILASRTLSESFTIEGLRERLVRWVVTDDQVSLF